MKVYAGTSGWLYDWNKGGNFEWFVEHSELNSVELNASFYRFPFPNQIKYWSTKAKGIRFSIKVHRKITHILKLNEQAIEVWNDFQSLFSPLKKTIDFYLFQMSPSFSPQHLDRVQDFFSKVGHNHKFAIEFRHPNWFDERMVRQIEKTGLVFVSVDNPQRQAFVVKTNSVIYIRFHGRGSWYSYDYSVKELEDISKQIYLLKPEYVYGYFNNNHNMLSNARKFLKMLVKGGI
ncbi:MAG: DUF72 domain-containing protein [Candidatus Omnitrophica bacterium]|nr:DUF72 domain-containing protein [Candidatus Omnitrophota bacterium]MCM8776965.1 DUF72 domain-containing protein [Candidatus Omnitrophota bacterium]